VDTLSHALWGNGLFGYKRYWKLAIFFGAFPDLISFGALFIVKLFNNSLKYVGPPTLESLQQLEPFPEWLFFMDNFSHSFVTAFLIISIVYFYKKEFVWPMLAMAVSYCIRYSFSYQRIFPNTIFMASFRYYL
tara:strand:+ start:828 stop:1226 length:399 start_codon:yes stop_codon:yes gene_type:complete